MNYFELYNIPVTLQPDATKVKQQFYLLSRKYHPDFYGQATADEQAEILEKASQVNQAYKVFQQPEETIKYVLQIKGLLEEEEKYQLSPDFLMEMMELNERAMELNGPEEAAQLRNDILNFENEIYEPVKAIVENYQEATGTEKELLQVKEYYYRKKYLKRILAGLA